ncbi:MAG TPA: VOC family protein [Vicinamibacterales bacterium]|nr:VOC family protein [Vicinamibacterales bacterium]
MNESRVTRRTAIRVAIAGAASVTVGAKPGSAQGATDMERVQGIGGFFFRAKDPKALAAWYAANLGVGPVPNDYGVQPWRTNAGTTAFAPFKEDTSYFGDRRFQWMINFRVADLDKMVAQLRGRGIAIDVDSQVYPNGRFARLADPEGNPIQLWQPSGKDAV